MLHNVKVMVYQSTQLYLTLTKDYVIIVNELNHQPINFITGHLLCESGQNRAGPDAPGIFIMRGGIT